MKYSSEMELVTVAVLSLVGLIFLWRIPIVNDLPLFLISYLLAIFLPGYTFLTFIKPDLPFITRLGMGVVVSAVLLMVTTLLYIYLQIPQAFTYVVFFLMVLSIILAFSSYLAGRMERVSVPPVKRKPTPPRKVVKKESGTSMKETDEMNLKEEGENSVKELGERSLNEEEKIQPGEEETPTKTYKQPPLRRTRLTPPEGEVELIIPNHELRGREAPKTSAPRKNTSSDEPALILPWIERQKELDREKKNP